MENAAGAAGRLSSDGNSPASQGGGAFIRSAALIANNIVFGNRASVAPEGVASGGGLAGSNDSTDIANLFYANPPDSYRVYDTVSTSGNAVADPQFQSSTTSYLPSVTSPAVDTGEVSVVEPGETDITGAPRMQGARVDMGAYEVPQPPAPSRIYVSPDGDDAHDGTTWATAKRTIPAGMCAVKLDGAVWVREGVYEGRLLPPTGVALYGGFRGDEERLEQRDFRTHPSILDGQNKGTVVTITDLRFRVTVDGFTIRNGGGTSTYSFTGGGIASSGKDVVIANNFVTDNSVVVAGTYPSAYCVGISAGTGPVTVTNNIVRNTLAAAYSDYRGFAGSASSYGAGIAAGGKATVANNLVYGNGAILSAMSSGLISFNTAAVIAVNITGSIVNNTVVDNAPLYNPPTGPQRGYPVPGISVRGDNPNLVLANNIIAWNGTGLEENGKATLSHNDFWANRAVVSGRPDPTGTDGNIAADPLFASRATEDYHLQPLSPCIDAGDDTAIFGPTDLDGRPRIIGPHVDIGAYETPLGGSYTVGDAASALRVAAGLNAPTSDVFDRLNIDAPDLRRIDIADAVRLLRKTAGMD